MQNTGTVVGVFTDSAAAQAAVEDLRDHGFTSAHIGVAGRDWREAGAGDDWQDLDNTYVGEGAVSGVAAGAGLGALWGMGIVAGVMPILGPALAGGTLAAILTSAAAGAMAAGVAGALVGMGIPNDEAEFYESEFHAGRIIVSVSEPNRALEAEHILEKHGAYNHTTQPIV